MWNYVGEVVEQKWKDLVDTSDLQKESKEWGKGHDSRGEVGLMEGLRPHVLQASLYRIKKVCKEKVCLVPMMNVKKKLHSTTNRKKKFQLWYYADLFLTFLIGTMQTFFHSSLVLCRLFSYTFPMIYFE